MTRPWLALVAALPTLPLLMASAWRFLTAGHEARRVAGAAGLFVLAMTLSGVSAVLSGLWLVTGVCGVLALAGGCYWRVVRRRAPGGSW
jgi:hypothetical protein